MTHKQIIPAALLLVAMALAGCSIASGDGANPPSRTTVIVPPNNTTTTTNSY